MTEDSDFKRLIRQRMKTTGENYLTARSALIRQDLADTASVDLVDAEPSPQPHDDHERPNDRSSLACYRGVDSSLSMQDVIQLRVANISPSDLAEWRQVLPNSTVTELAGAGHLGVDARAVGAWREIDAELSFQDILGCHAIGLRPDVFEKYREAEPNITVEEAQQLMTVGVEP